jgi:hypothetical protein
MKPLGLALEPVAKPILRGPAPACGWRRDPMKDQETKIAANERNEHKRRDRGHN